MKQCETFEMEISALIDGELPAAESLVVIDHLLQCPECSELYRLVRGVDQALEEARLLARTGDLPVGLWSRIDAACTTRAGAQDTVEAAKTAVQLLSPWIWKTAAAVLIMVGVWSLGQRWMPSHVLEDGALQVHLESDRGAMTDERFIDITTELLRADRRYHHKMLEIMTAINSHGYVNEGSPELAEPITRSESGETAAARGDSETAESELPETW